VVSAELIGGGVLLLALYVRHALRAPNPIIDLRLLGHATFRASVLGGFIFRIGVGAIPFLLPLMLQLGFGLSPFQSGLLTFASSAGALLMKFTAQPILNHLGFRRVLIFNTLISSAFLGLIAAFTPATPHILIIGALLMGGFFRSLQFTSINVIAYADVPDDRMSKATSFASAAQQLSLSFGVAAGAAVLEITRLRHGEAAYSAADFAPAILTVALISAAAVFVFMALPPNAGEVLTRKRGPVGEE
jgi:hypothetical protein